MVDRINNAVGVLGALKHLQSSGKDLSAADTRLASGLRVARASDDATAYHAAAVMRGQGGTLNAVTLSLSRAESISDTAIAGAEQAMKQLGATDIVSISACGSFREDLAPGVFVIVDQFIDRTTGRESSFFGRGCVAHVSMAEPVCPALGDALAAAVAAEQSAAADADAKRHAASRTKALLERGVVSGEQAETDDAAAVAAEAALAQARAARATASADLPNGRLTGATPCRA